MIQSRVFNVLSDGNITVLRFKELEKLDFINQAVSTRGGGVSSKKGLESLNLGTQTADEWENVVENYRRFCNFANFDIKRLVLGKQTHSTNVRKVSEKDLGKGVLRERDYTDVDALVTNIKCTPLVIHTADCVPVGFIDQKGRAIGNAHCGWRGTFGELAKNTVLMMEREYGVKASDLICTVGPCICQKCYEVSKELYDDFETKFGKGRALLFDGSNYYIDLAEINIQILLQCGVKKENIINSDLCTCCNTDIFFSHRGLGPDRGIFSSVIELV